MAPRLSAFLIVQNEAKRLPACLASLEGVADDIVVLDSDSSDDTVEIARAAGARVARRPFDGFGAQKQAALERCRGEWVLSIDADERLTPALANEIRGLLDGTPAAVGYEVRRELHYLGHRLRFGGTRNDWVLRLARRERARFTSATVHERLEVEGPVARLRSPMSHHKYERLAEHVAAMNRYTDLIAEAKSGRGSRFQLWHLARIPYELFVRLVLQGGLLDGRAGVIYAVMASYYGFLKYAKLYR
ncbi:MAG: glycosyltransferase family 2 protein [Gemmatimonadales bacterium]